jgi:catechol 2,3-dioxygenase-like lactoylglutathione lyase family enzyme
MTISPFCLNHAVLFVSDLERSAAFYTETFGMDVADREPRANAAFLRLARSNNHHDLGLFGVGGSGEPTRRGGIGLYHLAWQVDTIDELADARVVLLKSAPTPANRVTVPPRASTVPIRTTMSSRSCGCSPSGVGHVRARGTRQPPGFGRRSSRSDGRTYHIRAGGRAVMTAAFPPPVVQQSGHIAT